MLGNLFRLTWITKKTKTPFSWCHDFVVDKEKSKNVLKYQKRKPKEALKCQKIQKRIWQISTALVHPPKTSASIYPGVRASVVEAENPSRFSVNQRRQKKRANTVDLSVYEKESASRCRSSSSEPSFWSRV